MITFTKSYKTTDNQIFGSIEEAKTHELVLLLDKELGVNPGATVRNIDFAEVAIQNKDAIIDILTTTPDSKPKARAIHGGTKKRGIKVTSLNPVLPTTSPVVDSSVGSLP